MPTFDVLPSFWRDWVRLRPEQKAQFLAAVDQFYEDLKAGQGFRSGLRVKGVVDHPNIWEMSWNGDSRATFQFGTEVRIGHPHIVWRRIGTHRIFKNP